MEGMKVLSDSTSQQLDGVKKLLLNHIFDAKHRFESTLNHLDTVIERFDHTVGQLWYIMFDLVNFEAKLDRLASWKE